MADPSAIDRLNANLDALIEDAVAKGLRKFVYAGIWEYTVKGFNEGDQTATLSPVASDLLPQLTNIPVSLPALQSKLHENMTVTVAFANNDPAKPRIVNLDFASTYQGALAISRQGDMVTVPVVLVPAMAGQPPVPVPNAYSIFLATPPPPPFTPVSGGPASLYGCVSSGSTVNKSK